MTAEMRASAVVIVVMLDTPCSEVECKTTGYPLHSHVAPSLPLPCVTVCHQVSTELYEICRLIQGRPFFIYRVAQKERMFFKWVVVCLRFLSLGLPQIKNLRSKTSYSRRSESFHSRRNCNCATRNVSKCDAEL